MRRKKHLWCLLTIVICMMLSGIHVCAEPSGPGTNLPTEFHITLECKKQMKLGETISTDDFYAKCDNLGYFEISSISMETSKSPMYAYNTSGTSFYKTYGEKIEKDTYYAIQVWLLKSLLDPGDMSDYAGKTVTATINGKEAEVGRRNPAAGQIDFFVWINYSPQDLHPEHEGKYSKGADGVWSRTCANKECGEIETHTHTFGGWKSIVSATATREEVQTRQCTSDICNHESEERTVHSIHVYDSYNIISEPTATEDGRKTGTCRICNTTASFVIPHLESTAAKPSISSFPLKKGGSYTVTIDNLLETDSVASWTSHTPAVAAVDSNGRITGLKSGTAIIEAKLASGKPLFVTVKVQKKAVKTAKLRGLTKKLPLKKGEKYQLKAVRYPVTSNEKITYSTSNKKVAAVSKKGLIVAKKKGKATITVKSGKIKAKIKVTVTK